MTARVSMLLKSRASVTCFRACLLPGRAKDLSAHRYRYNSWRQQIAAFSHIIPKSSFTNHHNIRCSNPHRYASCVSNKTLNIQSYVRTRAQFQVDATPPPKKKRIQKQFETHWRGKLQLFFFRAEFRLVHCRHAPSPDDVIERMRACAAVGCFGTVRTSLDISYGFFKFLKNSWFSDPTPHITDINGTANLQISLFI